MRRLSEIYEKMKKTSLENAINSLKPPVFWKDRPIILAQAKKWNSKKIIKTLHKLYDLEIKMKTNSIINGDLLLKKLILDLCVEANA